MSDDEEQFAVRLPERGATVNQLVGFNTKWFRLAAGLTQEELGQRLGGWSKGVVSAAERSWESDRIRQFDADELVAIAAALGVPVVALLLPPPDAITTDYTFHTVSEAMDSDTVLRHVIPDYRGDSKPMAAFRERLGRLAGNRFMEPMHAEADRILQEARSFAHQLMGDAGDMANSLEHDASERHRQVMQSIVPQYEALEQRLEDLRAAIRETRGTEIAYHEMRLAALRAGAAEGPE